MKAARKLEDLIARLQSTDEDTQETAREELRKLADTKLSVQEGEQALRAATREFPSRDPTILSFLDTSANLVRAAAKNPHPKHIPLIVELFPQYN